MLEEGVTSSNSQDQHLLCIVIILDGRQSVVGNGEEGVTFKCASKGVRLTVSIFAQKKGFPIHTHQQKKRRKIPNGQFAFTHQRTPLSSAEY